MEKRLVRSREDKLIGGVCGGLGLYFGIDPTLIRIVFALLIVFGAGSPVLLYLLLWVIMPASDSPRAQIGVRNDGPAPLAQEPHDAAPAASHSSADEPTEDQTNKGQTES